MSLARSSVVVMISLNFLRGVAAQQPASAAGTGTVTGHVTCGDTQRPARFATVTLFGVPSEVTVLPKLDPKADADAQAERMKNALASIGKTNMATATTDMSGGYVAPNVAPGDYYVFASVAGYVSPMNEVEALVSGGADLKKPLPGIPVVHVVAEHAAIGDVTIDRGAAVSGNVMWDDGTPVTQAHVAVVPAKGEKQEPPAQFGMLATSGGLIALLAITDDQGHFRIAGLAPGDYLVTATLQSNNGLNMSGGAMNLSRILSQKPLVIYAPAAFHKADAKPISLGKAEDHRDVQITVNLGGMHTVIGRVGSAEDHHGLNSATVTLTDAQDKDFARSSSVDAAGNFTVTFVPPGTYDLEVSDAADTEPKKSDSKNKLINFSSDKTLRSYDDGKQSLIVSDSDVAGLNIELPPSKTVKKGVDFDGLFKEQ